MPQVGRFVVKGYMPSINEVKPQRANANRHTPRGMKTLEDSIQRDGWIGAITVAADHETFDGSARLEVGAATGFEDAIVVRSDGSKPVIHIREDIPTADDPRAKRLGIAANRVAQLNLAWDGQEIAALLEQDENLEGLFYDNELAALIAGDEAIDPAELWKGMPEFEQSNIQSWKSISVHFDNEGDYHEFSRLIGQTLTSQTRYIHFPAKQNEDVEAYRWTDAS